MVEVDLVLFDLDGTLAIPKVGNKIVEIVIMDYAEYIARKMGHDPKIVFKAVVDSLKSLRQHVPGDRSIAEVFMERIAERADLEFNDVVRETNKYYLESFPKFGEYYNPAPKASETIKRLLEMGIKVGIATDPIVLEEGNRQRLKWAKINHFKYCTVTSAENSHYVKPSIYYYLETINKCGSEPERTLMVGNMYEMDIEPIEKIGGKGVFIAFHNEEYKGGIRIKGVWEIFDVIKSLT